MRTQRWQAVIKLAVCGLCLWLPMATAADRIPPLAAVSGELSPRQQQAFTQKRQALEVELAGFKSAAEAFNAKTAENQSDAEFNAVEARRAHYIAAASDFNADMKAAVENARVIEKLDALAKKLGWSAEKSARLDANLNKLTLGGDFPLTPAEMRSEWDTILARDPTGDLAREAAQGGGLGFPGAGTQTVNQDCAIFALANAAGVPYGVVAARATLLMQEGEWRNAAERAGPQKAIEKRGLEGGEVVMLAEALGRAEVVPSADFAKHLAEGRPVMVDVVPRNGDARFGHEVVLTKAFQHGGETWYAVMDSNQGPERRLFLSAKELDPLLQENGVVFRPEPGSTPQLLR
jgi:hypothetical protein